jgi:hypothetical protein
MKYFAGLDGALEETAMWVVDETGQIMKEAGAASAPEARDALLSNLGLPPCRTRPTATMRARSPKSSEPAGSARCM